MEIAEAILWSRPLGGFDDDGSRTGLVRGRPLRRLGEEGTTLYIKSSLVSQVCMASPNVRLFLTLSESSTVSEMFVTLV